MGKKAKSRGRVLELGGSRGNTIDVEIAGRGKTYHIPLADSLSVGDAIEFHQVERLPKKKRDEGFFNAFYNLVCRYVPQEYIDGLTVDEFTALAEAWNDASKEVGGVSAGE